MENAADENKLIEQAQSGHREAFAELVRRHHPKAIGLCSSLLGTQTDGEDAAQEAFIKAYSSLHQFRGKAAFSTWLYRIAYRHCLDLIRSQKRRKTESWEALIEEKGEQVASLFASSPDVSHAAGNKELVQRVLATLSPDYKNILILREVQGLSYEEIAAAMGSSLDAVKARLRRARLDFIQKVRHLLEPKTVQRSEVKHGAKTI